MMLMDDSTQGVTWWLEIVKIARKGFEVLSKGEGQATAWRPKNLARVKKKVLAFSWGINQAMMVTLKWGIKYIGYIIESDLIPLKLTHIYWMESSHMLKMTVLKKKIKDWHVDTLTWCWGFNFARKTQPLKLWSWNYNFHNKVYLQEKKHSEDESLNFAKGNLTSLERSCLRWKEGNKAKRRQIFDFASHFKDKRSSSRTKSQDTKTQRRLMAKS